MNKKIIKKYNIYMILLIIIFLGCNSKNNTKNNEINNISSEKNSKDTLINNISNISYIAFHFEHFMRIPFKEVNIIIRKRQNNTNIEIHSKPANKDKQWIYSKIDTSFDTTQKFFEQLARDFNNLKEIDLNKAIIDGEDGIDCKLEYGSYANKFIYEFWSPDYMTKERGLEKYLELCYKIIEISRLNPKEIF